MRHRDEVTHWSHLLLGGSGLYVATALLHNIMRVNASSTSPVLVGIAGVFVLGLWMLAFAIAGCIGVIRHLPSLREWGFVIDRRLWFSVVLVLAASILVLPQLPDGVPFLDASLLLVISAATLEEVVFRGVMLNTLLNLLQPRNRWTVAGLICCVGAVWASVHIPTKSPVEVWGLFTSAIVLGYVYYYTRSLLFPICSHVTANAGLLGGVIAVLGYFAVAGVVLLLARSGRTCGARPT